MTKRKASEVESLLEERQQLENWLERLDLSGGDDVPDAVRGKVRDDYQARLDVVLEKLSKFADELRGALQEEIARREDLWSEERTAKEKIAEASLRHEVGEHDDKVWHEIQAESSEELSRITSELDSATAEIARLEDVLSAMSPGHRRESSDEQGAPASALGDDEGESDDEDQTDAFDGEITLIKSATSGAEADVPAEEVEEEKPAEKLQTSVARPSSIGQAGLPTGKRTLKCSDCGKMNLPTEWYCEHCGAELASL
ncbi:MAG: hypothetical protein ACE5FJ_03345 [Gemmatimonadales bacterium]